MVIDYRPEILDKSKSWESGWTVATWICLLSLSWAVPPPHYYNRTISLQVLVKLFERVERVVGAMVSL